MHPVKDKEHEKIEKYKFLWEQIGNLRKLKKVKVVPVVIGALGAVSDMFEKYMGKLSITIRLSDPENGTLETAEPLQKVLSI